MASKYKRQSTGGRFKQRSAGGEHWRLFDSTRSTTNQVDDHLFPSHNSAESAETGCDFLANGFKMRNADAHQNANNQTYFFMAFAEQIGTTPFETEANAG